MRAGIHADVPPFVILWASLQARFGKIRSSGFARPIPVLLLHQS